MFLYPINANETTEMAKKYSYMSLAQSSTHDQATSIGFWANEDIYNKMLNSNNKDKAFYLHDGPPYANGNMHIGHALNKSLITLESNPFC